MSRKDEYDTLGTLPRVEPNIAVRVSNVVIPIPTRPKSDRVMY
jgi:hypothetical protein